jgi:integrase
MSAKFSITTCDYINFDTALNIGKKLMQSGDTNKEILGFYIITSIYTGFRVSDIKTITYSQIDSGIITIKEQKTNKLRETPVHPEIKEARKMITRKNDYGFIFISQKGGVYTTQQLNRLLKQAFIKLIPTHCISSHSLRKTFGRRVYENMNQSEHALTMLCEIFNHSNLKMTRAYLGLKQEEFNSVYLSL